MKKKDYFISSIVIAFLFAGSFNIKQTEPWTQDQLMAPEALASIINDSTSVKPLIVSIGPVNLIKGAIKIGPVNEKENLNEFKKLLSKTDKKRSIIIYCGCCPFKNCPNIRPAFIQLNKMNFINHKLLNLPHNLKVDWIDHNYPMSN
jgi:thiosulfate/3-mercaptopyruvate sulfurtransferase